MRTRPKAASTSGGVLPFSRTCGSSGPGPWAAMESRQITLAIKSTSAQETKVRKSSTRPTIYSHYFNGLAAKLSVRFGQIDANIVAYWTHFLATD